MSNVVKNINLSSAEELTQSFATFTHMGVRVTTTNLLTGQTLMIDLPYEKFETVVKVYEQEIKWGEAPQSVSLEDEEYKTFGPISEETGVTGEGATE